MDRKKTLPAEPVKKRVIKREPKPGTWAAVVKSVELAKKVGLTYP